MKAELLLTLLAAGLAWLTVYFIVPAASRARFIGAVSAIRDDCDDAIIYKELPDSDPVRHFLSKTQMMLDDARSLGGLSFLFAVHSVVRKVDFQPPSPPSYSNMSQVERQVMHALDERLVKALTAHAIGGSSLWWFYRPIYAFICRRSGRRPSERTKTLSPGQLAREYNRAADNSKFSGIEQSLLRT